MNLLPSTVVRGVSAVSTSLVVAVEGCCEFAELDWRAREASRRKTATASMERTISQRRATVEPS
jgi:hypothetical protein